MSCENSTSSMFFCHKHFSREQMQAHEVLTPAELSLVQYYYFTLMSYRLYLPGIILFLHRNLTLGFTPTEKNKISEQNTLIFFIYSKNGTTCTPKGTPPPLITLISIIGGEEREQETRMFSSTSRRHTQKKS